METNENYEALKGSARTFLQLVTSDNLYYGIFLFILMLVLVKMIDLLFLPFRKVGKENIQMNFLKACLKVFVIITIGMRIFSLSDALSGFTSHILMSSSLIVVVLGFVFQEGLSNIVHGFILSIFRPFNLGDRVHLTVDGESITGYVQAIDLRHTIIQNVINSSHVIVPNSKMDLCVIDNNYYRKEQVSSNFLDFSVTYESDLEAVIKITEDVILADPLVQIARKEKKITDPVGIMVRDLGDSGISIRATVVTRTVEENFKACSDIRRNLVAHFRATPAMEFAYPHVEVVKGQGRQGDSPSVS